MTSHHNPQAEQMADESMVRCLRAQAEAIWPQESRLLDAYRIPEGAALLDVGCGTGEIVARLAERFPTCTVTGVDILPDHLRRARRRAQAFGDRVRFQTADAFALPFAADRFDLVLCRHLLQAVPEPARVLAELRRVTRSGGRVHLVAEDYAMMHFHPVSVDTDRFWHEGPMVFAERTGSDLRVGRKAHTLLRRLGLRDVTVDYVVVDTLRVPRATFAAIWEAWRDGYSRAIAEHSNLTADEIATAWEQMLAAIRDPDGYGVWQVPVVTGVVP